MASENGWHADRETALDLILDATLRPEAWNDFIAHVCKVVGANSGAIAVRSSQPALELIDPVAATWPDEAVEAYLTYPREADPVAMDLTLSMFALRNCKSFITQELLDDDAYRRTPFFNDFASKFDIAYMAGVSVDVGADHFGTLMLYRDDGSLVFGQHERRFIESLVKPLRIGLETRRRFKGTTLAHGVLARLAIPVVTLDERGRVAYMNQAADQLFQRGDVSISGGRIRTSRPDTTSTLQAVCREAVRGDIPRQGHELFLQRTGGSPPLRLLILPLPGQLSDSLWGGWDVPVAIFFFDAQEDTPPSDASTRLRQSHGCTDTEARVAMRYADGATGPEIAEQLGVSSETIKTHLKKVFQKTRVKNKAELAKLIQKLSAPVR